MASSLGNGLNSLSSSLFSAISSMSKRNSRFSTLIYDERLALCLLLPRLNFIQAVEEIISSASTAASRLHQKDSFAYDKNVPKRYQLWIRADAAVFYAHRRSWLWDKAKVLFNLIFPASFLLSVLSFQQRVSAKWDETHFSSRPRLLPLQILPISSVLSYFWKLCQSQG